MKKNYIKKVYIIMLCIFIGIAIIYTIYSIIDYNKFSEIYKKAKKENKNINTIMEQIKLPKADINDYDMRFVLGTQIGVPKNLYCEEYDLSDRSIIVRCYKTEEDLHSTESNTYLVYGVDDNKIALFGASFDFKIHYGFDHIDSDILGDNYYPHPNKYTDFKKLGIKNYYDIFNWLFSFDYDSVNIFTSHKNKEISILTLSSKIGAFMNKFDTVKSFSINKAKAILIGNSNTGEYDLAVFNSSGTQVHNISIYVEDPTEITVKKVYEIISTFKFSNI